MSGATAGILVGVLGGGGLAYAAARLPPARPVRLEDRLGPYLRDTPRPSRLLAERGRTPVPLGAVEALARPLLADLAGALDRLLGGRAALFRRLEQAGGRTTLEEFRIQQVTCATAGALVGALLLAAHGLTGSGPPPIVGVAGVIAGVAGGISARDGWLGRAIRHRGEAMLAELPTIAELIALAVTAGESPVGALERVTRLCRGELGRELVRALADLRAGAALPQALQGVADRTALAPLARFVDGMTIAIERGTPLGDVLRAQAGDVREASKRQLLEAGGRKEIAMMVPTNIWLGYT